MPNLTEEFVLVPPAFLHSKEPTISVCSEATSKFMLSATTAEEKNEETAWLKHVISQDTNNIGLDVSWAAYHASCQTSSTDFFPGISTLLPLFYEDSASVATIKHAMNIIKQVTQFLN